MAKYGSDVAKVEFDNASDALQDMSAYVTEPDPMVKSIETEETTPVASANATHASTGVAAVDEITLKGPYDDTATTGSHAIFNSIGSMRTLKYTYGNSKTTAVECIITSYVRGIKVKGLTGYEVKLQPTGAVTEA